MSVPESLTVLTHALTRGTQPTLPGRAPRAGKDAAVLALIGDADTDPFLVFIEKLGTLRHHPGQIAFPGGRMEPEDPSPVAAAVREAREETGLDTTGIEVVGTLPPAYLFAGEWDVTPAVAWWR